MRRATPYLVLLFVLALICLSIWMKGHSYEIRDAAYPDASKAAPIRVFVPPQARNITAWVRPGQMAVTAAFEIEEADFVTWARTKDWGLKDVVDTDICHISDNANPNGHLRIARGLLYERIDNPKTPSRGLIRIYAYDQAKKIGYFTQF
jgi:hypothetical protein